MSSAPTLRIKNKKTSLSFNDSQNNAEQPLPTTTTGVAAVTSTSLANNQQQQDNQQQKQQPRQQSRQKQRQQPYSDPLAPPPSSQQQHASSTRVSRGRKKKGAGDASLVEVTRLVLDDDASLRQPLLEEDYQQQHQFFVGEDGVESNNDNDDLVPPVPSDFSIWWGAVANLCSATLGAGILSLPLAFYQAGIVTAFVLLVSSASMTLMSIQLLLELCETYKIYSYETLCCHLLGPWARTTSEITILILCQGCAVAYVIAIGDILQQAQLLIPVFHDDTGHDHAAADAVIWKNRAASVILLFLVTMLPLSLLRSMQQLQWASAIGLASIGTLVFSALIHLLQDGNVVLLVSSSVLSFFSFVFDNNDDDDTESGSSSSAPARLSKLLLLLFVPSSSSKTTTLFHDSSNNNETTMAAEELFLSQQQQTTNQQHESFWSFVWPSNGWVSVLTACPIILFSFFCQTNVCAIYHELPIQSNNMLQQSQPAASTSNGDIESNNNNNTTNADVIFDKTNHPRYQMMNRVAWGQVSICSLLYASMGCIGLADFGSQVTPNILSAYNTNNDNKSELMQVAMMTMALAVVIAFPFNIFPARDTLAGMLYPNNTTTTTSTNNSNNNHTQTTDTTTDSINHGGSAAVTSTMAADISNGNRNKSDKNNTITSRVSSVSTTTSMITPSVVIPDDNIVCSSQQQQHTKGLLTPNPELTAALLEDVGGAEAEHSSISCCGTTINGNSDEDHGEDHHHGDNTDQSDQEQSLLTPSTTAAALTIQSEQRCSTTTTPALEQQQQQQHTPHNMMASSAPPSLTLPLSQHILLTLFLTLSSLAVGILVPDLAVVFGLLGGTTASMIGFILPGLMGIQYCRDNLQRQHPNNNRFGTLILSWSLFLGGSVVGIVTTSVTVYETFHKTT